MVALVTKQFHIEQHAVDNPDRGIKQKLYSVSMYGVMSYLLHVHAALTSSIRINRVPTLVMDGKSPGSAIYNDVCAARPSCFFLQI